MSDGMKRALDSVEVAWRVAVNASGMLDANENLRAELTGKALVSFHLLVAVDPHKFLCSPSFP